MGQLYQYISNADFSFWVSSCSLLVCSLPVSQLPCRFNRSRLHLLHYQCKFRFSIRLTHSGFKGERYTSWHWVRSVIDINVDTLPSKVLKSFKDSLQKTSNILNITKHHSPPLGITLFFQYEYSLTKDGRSLTDLHLHTAEGRGRFKTHMVLRRLYCDQLFNHEWK